MKKKYVYMKEKYNIVIKAPYKELIDNIIYILGLSHYYNLLKNESKNNYVSMNFLNNSTAIVEFCAIMPDNIKYLDFAICNSLNNVFGRQSFQCITCIPPNIMLDIIKNEDIYNNHSKLIKKILKDKN